MVLREIKNKVNLIVKNLLLKSYNISKDKRLTQKPVFELMWGQRPGIRHPEITPTLPLLEFVHNQSPSIKVATMRLRESIFRRGFKWERKWESKCKECSKEYIDIVSVCEECGSNNIILPDIKETIRADKFFEQCNIYDPLLMGKRKLIHFLKQAEDHLNIFDDVYVIGIKEYWQDREGLILGSTLQQIVLGNPVTMRMVVDEYGEPGGRWYTCLRHRDQIEEEADKKCKKCGRKLYEVHYVSVMGGGDNPEAYYIGDEVIHVSKYRPSSTYGFSPIVTLWQTALTLTNMTEYIYRAYSEAHLPKGVLAMKTSNPESACEFWRDVDDKLNKDPHYIPKMFLEGEGQGSGSGMEFIRFMDTLEEMQYIPVRDEIRRTIASIYGVMNIFIGDTSQSSGLNSESEQINITNMAAESGIAVYNEHIMPELLRWLHIEDWKYVLQSPFEENKQRELNENMTKVQIAQSMLQMGLNVELGEEDVFEFKYSGTPKSQGGMDGFGQQNMPQLGGTEPQNIGEEGKSWASPPKHPVGYEEYELEKSRVYINHPNQAPKGSKIQRSPRGKLYYESERQIQPQRPNEQTLEMDKRRRIETLLNHTNEHYDNLLEEYKHSKDINPGHAMSLEQDLTQTRNLIRDLQLNYNDLIGNPKKMEKESEGANININIHKENDETSRKVSKYATAIMKYACDNCQFETNDEDEFKLHLKERHKIEKCIKIEKYLGEQEDRRLTKEFYKELNHIFNEEIQKIMVGAEKFSKNEIQTLITKVLNESILKMTDYTRQHLGLSYREGQQYVAELVGKAINFQKVDEMALKSITEQKVLFDSYKDMSNELSKKLNDVIEESFRHPETHSIANMVKTMQESSSDDLWKLSRIARTESHVASQTGRAVAFKKVDPNNEYRFKWAIRRDSRTSDVCKSIDVQVEKEGSGKGVSLERLNEILKENVAKYYPKLEFRPWMCHPNCRSGLIRVF